MTHTSYITLFLGSRESLKQIPQGHKDYEILLKFKQMDNFPPDTPKPHNFCTQVYGTREASEASRSSHSNYTFSNGYDLHAPVHLQLSQPQPPKTDTPAKSMKLG